MTSSEPSLPPALASLLDDQEVTIGSRAYRLLFVHNIDALLDALPGNAEIPYWSILWESAIALSNHILEHPDEVRGKDVLELGTGLGLCGMIAQETGARVTQTDNHADSLAVAALNARRNDIPVPGQFLADWRRWDHDTQYDVIVGSDIVYERPVHQLLLSIFRRNLKPGGRLILADPQRESGWEMGQSLEREGWRVEIESRRVDWEGKTREILLLRAGAGV